MEKIFTYIATSPVYISHLGEQDELDRYSLVDESEDAIEGLASRIEEEMKEIGSRGLAESLSEPLNSIIDTIIVSVDNQGARTIIKAKKELTNKEVESLKDYLIGQYSDGWGEVFEQQSLDTYESEYEAQDEEDGTSYMEKEKVDIYAHFWSNKNFSVEIKKV